MSASNDIDAALRAMPADVRNTLKKAARLANITDRSLVWILSDVYESGHLRSNAYRDVPEHVKLDGLVTEREPGLLEYTPWQFTEKAKDILAKTRP